MFLMRSLRSNARDCACARAVKRAAADYIGKRRQIAARSGKLSQRYSLKSDDIATVSFLVGYVRLDLDDMSV